MKAFSPNPVHISSAGGGMCANIAARCSSVMRSRIRPRISQTLSPWYLAKPWPGRSPHSSMDRLAAASGSARVSSSSRWATSWGAARRAGPRPPAGPRRRRRPRRQRRPGLPSNPSASSCCSRGCRAAPRPRSARAAGEDDLLLAVVVRLQEGQDVVVVVGDLSTRAASPGAMPPTSPAPRRGVSRNTPCTAYMSVTSGRGAAPALPWDPPCPPPRTAGSRMRTLQHESIPCAMGALLRRPAQKIRQNIGRAPR